MFLPGRSCLIISACSQRTTFYIYTVMWVRTWSHPHLLRRLRCMVQVYLLSWITSPLLFLAHNPAGCRRSLYVVHRSSWWSGRVSFSAMGGVEPEGPTRVPDPIPDHESMTHTNAHRRCQVHAVQNTKPLRPVPPIPSDLPEQNRHVRGLSRTPRLPSFCMDRMMDYCSS